MPSLEHSGLVEMFRDNPGLAPHLVEALFHLDLPRHVSAGVVDSALDQLIPVEFRADLVIELKDASGRVVLSIVLEVQLASDADKKFSWPVYLVVERSRKRCPVIVLVVAPDEAVAAWAAEGIDLGLGCSHVRPLVVGPSALPALHALRRLDREHAAELIYDALREPMRRALEKLIMENRTQAEETIPSFAHMFIKRGAVVAKQEDLLRVMARLGLEPTEEQRARILACTDLATLDRWFDAAFGSKTAADALT